MPHSHYVNLPILAFYELYSNYVSTDYKRCYTSHFRHWSKTWAILFLGLWFYYVVYDQVLSKSFSILAIKRYFSVDFYLLLLLLLGDLSKKVWNQCLLAFKVTWFDCYLAFEILKCDPKLQSLKITSIVLWLKSNFKMKLNFWWNWTFFYSCFFYGYFSSFLIKKDNFFVTCYIFCCGVLQNDFLFF